MGGLCVPRIETLCDLLATGNTAGWFFLSCDDIEFIPAECPEETDPEAPAYLEQGVIKVGPVTMKVASVGAMADLMVQRDSDGAAYATRWEVETDPCAANGSRIEQWNAHIGSPFVADDPGEGVIASSVRLRSNGDIGIYGGDLLPAQRGIGKFFVYGSQFSPNVYQRLGAPHPLAGGTMFSHLWLGTDVVTATDYTLAELHTDTVGALALGTIYNPGGWAAVSDIRLKENPVAEDANDCLSRVCGLEVISFEMGGRKFSGFSAQNVRGVMPDCVGTLRPSRTPPDAPNESNSRNTPDHDLLTVRHGDILAQAVGAIRALKAEIVELKARIATLEGK